MESKLVVVKLGEGVRWGITKGQLEGDKLFYVLTVLAFTPTYL